jgi:3-hydroxymyristoyl/3-hydroxydecanoyl-(acyl carrier protein) dehydratase
MDTVFGFFPGDAFANQAGLPATANEQAFLARAGEFRLELRGATTDAFSQPGAPLAAAPLLMLDRITGWWPQAGEAGLGIASAETDVRAAEWFFKAHFMQDPVQPGSLGIEALLQLLQAAMRLGGIGKKWGDTACFEPVALGEPLTWKYRGQVVPSNGRIQTFVELLKIEPHADEAITVRARGSLWVDGKKIYETCACFIASRRTLLRASSRRSSASRLRRGSMITGRVSRPPSFRSPSCWMSWQPRQRHRGCS